MLDFLRAASGGYEALTTDGVALGEDANLVHEFMEIERIMAQQYATVDVASEYGNNDAYVCKVANVHAAFECLDIAGADTLAMVDGTNQFNFDFWNLEGGDNHGLDVMLHTDILLDIMSPFMTHTGVRKFGIDVEDCDENAAPAIGNIGDGQINGFDLYVLTSVQFGSPPYDTLEQRFAAVETVRARERTGDRCFTTDPLVRSRLGWQQMIATNPCAAAPTEGRRTRRLEVLASSTDASPTRMSMIPTAATPVIPSSANTTPDAGVVRFAATPCRRNDAIESCLDYDKPLYFAYLPLVCYDQTHRRVSLQGCVSVSEALARHVEVYAHPDGIVLSTATKSAYDATVGHTNAPLTTTTDLDAPRHFALWIRRGVTIATGREGQGAEFYTSPVDNLTIDWGALTQSGLDASGPLRRLQESDTLPSTPSSGETNPMISHTLEAGVQFSSVNGTTVPLQSAVVGWWGAHGSMAELGARVFEWIVHPQGTWYLINLCGVYTAVELTMLGLGPIARDMLGLSNAPAPAVNSTTIPAVPTQGELRFVRHREYHGLDTSACAIVRSSRSPTIAMQNGVISVSQELQLDRKLCGFDLVLWVPRCITCNATGPLRIVAGSTAMDGGRGSFQSHTVFATRLRQLVFAQNVQLPSQVNGSVIYPPTPPTRPPAAPPAAAVSLPWSWLAPTVGVVVVMIGIGGVAWGGFRPWQSLRVPTAEATATESGLPLLILPIVPLKGDEGGARGVR